MKILFLTNLLPYPLDNGGKINTYTKIAALKKGGHNVDLITFKETQNDVTAYEEHMKQYCRDVFQVYLRLTTAENKGYMINMAARSLFSKYSFGVYKYKCKEMELLLKKLADERKYDCIYYDHLQLYIYEPLVRKLWPSAKDIIDEHNCETIIMERNAIVSGNIVKKAFFKIEAAKLKRFENKSIKKAFKTVVLSEADRMALAKQLGEDFPYVIIPNRVAETAKLKETNEQQGQNLKILFVGTMTWSPNNDGIVWFLETVYSKLKRNKERVEMYIVGKNPSGRVLELAREIEGVNVAGYVESVDPYYDMCDFMVVPLFVGSGQRIKIIEAFSRKMPVLSTTIGAEGLEYINGENILIADTPEEFLAGIEKYKDVQMRTQVAESARRNYDSHYSTEAIGARFNSIFNEI